MTFWRILPLTAVRKTGLRFCGSVLKPPLWPMLSRYFKRAPEPCHHSEIFGRIGRMGMTGPRLALLDTTGSCSRERLVFALTSEVTWSTQWHLCVDSVYISGIKHGISARRRKEPIRSPSGIRFFLGSLTCHIILLFIFLSQPLIEPRSPRRAFYNIYHAQTESSLVVRRKHSFSQSAQE